MKHFELALALGFALGAIGTLATAAQSAPLHQSDQMAAAASTLTSIAKTQFILGGRHYCFYPEGWHGPGWYWCGYALRRGLGWGGPTGWHGWHAAPGPDGHPVHGSKHGTKQGPMHHGPGPDHHP